MPRVEVMPVVEPERHPEFGVAIFENLYIYALILRASVS
jgi:hypothetical protein